VVGELKLKISGCINACGHHHAGHIGILGVDKKGVENYQLLLGGCEGRGRRSAKITGPGFDEDGVSMRSRRPPTSISPAHRRANASSIPTAASAWPRSRRRSMAEVQFRFRDDEPVADPAVTVDSFGEQTNATAVRIEPGDDARDAAAAP
jgi:sulfite reductase beta subunit-like hemoprotein